MKNLFLIIIMALFLAPSTINAKNNKFDTENKSELLKVRTFKGSITLSGGCHISYSITIDYSLLPPAINSVHGSLTFSGSCTGTQTFRMAAKTDKDGNVLSVESDVKLEESKMEEFNSAFVKELNSLSLFKE